MARKKSTEATVHGALAACSVSTVLVLLGYAWSRARNRRIGKRLEQIYEDWRNAEVLFLGSF